MYTLLSIRFCFTVSPLFIYYLKIWIFPCRLVLLTFCVVAYSFFFPQWCFSTFLLFFLSPFLPLLSSLTVGGYIYPTCGWYRFFSLISRDSSRIFRVHLFYRLSPEIDISLTDPDLPTVVQESERRLKETPPG